LRHEDAVVACDLIDRPRVVGEGLLVRVAYSLYRLEPERVLRHLELLGDLGVGTRRESIQVLSRLLLWVLLKSLDILHHLLGLLAAALLERALLLHLKNRIAMVASDHRLLELPLRLLLLLLLEDLLVGDHCRILDVGSIEVHYDERTVDQVDVLKFRLGLLSHRLRRSIEPFIASGGLLKGLYHLRLEVAGLVAGGSLRRFLFSFILA